MRRSINIPRSIQSVFVDPSGHLIVTYGDGSRMDAGSIVGPPGQSVSGTGIKSAAVDASGNLSISLTDGSTLGPWTVRGAPGSNGVGIASGSVDAAGNLTLVLTTGATIGGNLKGPPGASAQQPTFTASLTLGAVGSTPSATMTSSDGLAWSLALKIPAAKDGTNGTTPSISVGTVTTLALGAAPTVKRHTGDTDAAPVFDFGLPAGNLGGSFDIAMAAIAIGVATTYTVTVPGATTDMCAVVNPPASLLGSLSGWRAAVIAANTVTIYLGVSIALGAATRTFKIRVIQ